jgi:peptidoglycan/xylan/chitin deacetylase (PgdA/CDA1 family)
MEAGSTGEASLSASGGATRNGVQSARTRAQHVVKRAAHAIDRPRALFEAHLELVNGRGGASVLDEALLALERPAPARPDPVVVTFDDGTADFVDVALPLLVKHRVPALLYVATRFVEERRAFPDGGIPVSWAALRDALSTGFVTLGSHTHSHALLDRVDPATATSEIDRSIDLIGDRTGVVARHFAYPKALRGNAAVRAVVRSRFRSAALAGTRSNRYGRTDPYRLARSPVQYSDGVEWFTHKLAGGLRLEDDVRRIANRLRYRGARS